MSTDAAPKEITFLPPLNTAFFAAQGSRKMNGRVLRLAGERTGLCFVLVLLFGFLFDTASDGQADQHSQADTGADSQGGADG